MNLLFLTVTRFTTIYESGIYIDLMRKFRDEGHQVYVVAPTERRYKKATNLKKESGAVILNVKTLNIIKTNVIEKGIGTLLLETQFLFAINKYFSDIKFDIVVYSTPPITFTKVIQKIKARDHALTYLLLKDIFPQNAVDLGMIKQNSLLHKYFYIKEKELYAVSDFIGCMSPANVKYILKQHAEIKPECIEVNPNSIALNNSKKDKASPEQIRKDHALPKNKTTFIYGGNLGKPQGIDFLIETIEASTHLSNAFFVVIGSGTEYPRIKKWFETFAPKNAKLLEGLPKDDYDNLVSACDVGLIFLDPRFTIPNYPSRLLSYLENSMPVITATDPNTDIGIIAEENGYGFKCISGDIETMKQHIQFCCENPEKVKKMGQKGYDFLKNNYTVQHSYDIIMKHFNKNP